MPTVHPSEDTFFASTESCSYSDAASNRRVLSDTDTGIYVKVRCLCGGNSGRLELECDHLPGRSRTCSCDTCRHTTGTLYVSALPLREQPSFADDLNVHQTCRRVTRYFCAEFGSHMLIHNNHYRAWYVCSGVIDQLPTGDQPSEALEDLVQHHFLADTRDGGLMMCLANPESQDEQSKFFLQGYVKNPIDIRRDLPPWPTVERTKAVASVDQHSLLHAACHCGNVEFYISRPNDESQRFTSPWPGSLRTGYDPANSDDMKWWIRKKNKYLATACMCRSCRLGAGVPIQTWAFIPQVNLRSSSYVTSGLDLSYLHGLETFESSPGNFREFCETCGATMFWHSEDRPSIYSVAVGLLRAIEGSLAQSWLDWHTDSASFADDALDKRLSRQFEAGLPTLSTRIVPDNLSSPFYRPLKPFHGFRILALQPAADYLDTLEGQLIDANLNDHLPFEALSYVWGDVSRQSSITIEDQRITITSSLDTALRHLRYATIPRNLWVDALCINQANKAERSIHVQYMKEIYQRCQYDLLWLGPNPKIVSDCMQSMKDIGTLMELRTPDVEIKHADAIAALLQKPPVWKRTWIMQEVSCSPDGLLIAGRETMSWRRLEEWLDTERYVKKYGVPDAFHGPVSHDTSARSFLNSNIAFPLIVSHQRMILQDDTSVFPRSEWGVPMLDMLARFRYTQATDPRDKIYGLLGMIENKEGVVVDYGRSVRDVFIDVTRKLLLGCGNLDLLCQGPWELGQDNPTSTFARRPDLPSYVPDFSNAGESRIMFAQRGIFKADGGGKIDSLSPLTTDGNLVLSGWPLGTIAFVGQGPNGELHVSSGTKLIDLILKWMPNHLLHEGSSNVDELLQQYINVDKEIVGKTPNPHDGFDDYWRTLMLDCIRNRGPLHRVEHDEIHLLRMPFEKLRSSPQEDVFFFMSYDNWENFSWLNSQQSHLLRVCSKWAFARTEQGLYCMVTRNAEKGDRIVVLKGGKVPVVLRLNKESNGIQSWKWVGTCYVHRHMDGEVAKEFGEASLKGWNIV